MKSIAILGGGLAGCALAHYLKQDCTIFEKENTIGGLCRTINGKDFGPHILFSKKEGMMDEYKQVLDKNWREYKRHNKVIVRDNKQEGLDRAIGRTHIVDYPFEQGMKNLPDELKARLVTDFVTAQSMLYIQENEMLDNMLRGRYGETMTDIYLRPYNKLMWTKEYYDGLDPQELSARMPYPSYSQFVHNAFGVTQDIMPYQSTFIYPIEGGIQALPQALLTQSNGHVRTNEKILNVVKINREYEITTTADTYRFNKVFSTLPLPELVKVYRHAPDTIARKCRELWYIQTSIWEGIHGREVEEPFMSVFGQVDNTPYHRMTLYPDNKMYMEESKPAGAELPDYSWANAQYSYPVRRMVGETVDSVIEYFNSTGIVLCGRFAEWKYMNMDDVMISAKEKSEA